MPLYKKIKKSKKVNENMTNTKDQKLTKVKCLDDISTLNKEELQHFWSILWFWINADDKTYELYSHVRDLLEDDSEMNAFFDKKKTKEFLHLLEKDLEEPTLTDYKETYEKQKKEYEEYMQSKNNTSVLN